MINNRIINLRVPEKLNDNFNKDDFVIVENKVKKSNINQFKSLIKDEPLIKEKLTGSIITETIQYTAIGTTELRLSNGIKVYLKPTNNKKESFHFQALSMGGHSHASLDELLSLIHI